MKASLASRCFGLQPSLAALLAAYSALSGRAFAFEGSRRTSENLMLPTQYRYFTQINKGDNVNISNENATETLSFGGWAEDTLDSRATATVDGFY